MTYDDYIAHIDALWTAAQQREDLTESEILTAILYRLVHPRGTAVIYLTNLLASTADPVYRRRYEQAIADIQRCEELPVTPAETEESEADGPMTAEQLAQLAYKLYQQTAPQYGLIAGSTPWESLPEAQQQCALAVARRLLRRIEAHVRYVAHTVNESEATHAVH